MQDHCTIPQDIPLKRCYKCEESKPATTEHFSRSNKTKDAFHAECKECNKRYRKENKEKIAAYKRQYGIDKPEKKKINNEKHRESNEAKRRLRYEQNGDMERRQHRAWSRKNKDRVIADRNRRRAFALSSEGQYTSEDARRQYKAQRGKCYYCNCKVGNKYHVDHVIPLSRGGSNGPENIAIACPSCNLSKGSKLPTEWKGSNRLL